MMGYGFIFMFLLIAIPLIGFALLVAAFANWKQPNSFNLTQNKGDPSSNQISHCVNCNGKLESDWKHCPHCGKQIVQD